MWFSLAATTYQSKIHQKKKNIPVKIYQKRNNNNNNTPVKMPNNQSLRATFPTVIYAYPPKAPTDKGCGVGVHGTHKATKKHGFVSRTVRFWDQKDSYVLPSSSYNLYLYLSFSTASNLHDRKATHTQHFYVHTLPLQKISASGLNFAQRHYWH